MRALIVLLPLFAVAACDRQSSQAPQANVATASNSAMPEAAGALDIAQRGAAMPKAAFTGPDGAKTTLSAFRGKPVLLNLWATWCGPCVKEMPSLDRLASRGDGKLVVLTVSQDIQGKPVVDPWWRARGFTHLKPSLDPENGLSTVIGGGMLPTTVLYDKNGKEVWRIAGAMDWDGPRANTLLAEVL